jgi:hypothetical protein
VVDALQRRQPASHTIQRFEILERNQLDSGGAEESVQADLTESSRRLQPQYLCAISRWQARYMIHGLKAHPECGKASSQDVPQIIGRAAKPQAAVRFSLRRSFRNVGGESRLRRAWPRVEDGASAVWVKMWLSLPIRPKI